MDLNVLQTSVEDLGRTLEEAAVMSLHCSEHLCQEV